MFFVSYVETQSLLSARWYTIKHSIDKLKQQRYNPDVEMSLPYKKLLSGTYYPLTLPDDIKTIEKHELWTKLGHFLFWTAGILRKEWNHPYVDHRSFPSPRSIYATEFYLLFRSTNEEDKTWNSYRYSPTHHRLELAKNEIPQEKVKIACGLSDQNILNVEFFMMINSNVWRMGCKYSDFAYRLILLEAGHAIENLIDLSRYYGWEAKGQFLFVDHLLASFIGIDMKQEPSFSVFSFFSQNNSDSEKIYKFKHDGVHYNNHSKQKLESMECKWQEITGNCKGIADLEEKSRIFSLAELKSIRGKLSDEGSLRGNNSYDFRRNSTLKNRISDINQRHSGRGPFGINGPKRLVSKEESKLFFLYLQHALNDMNSIVDCHIRPNIYMVPLQMEGFQQGVYQIGEDLIPTLVNSNVSVDIMREGYLGGSINFNNLPVHWFITADIEKYLNTYGSRGYRIAHLMGGIISQKILLGAGHLGMFARPIMAFDDLIYEKLLNINYDDEIILEHILIGTNRYKGWQIMTFPNWRKGNLYEK